MSDVEREMQLSHWQSVTLRRLLRQQLKRDLKRVETNDRRGWQPAEGCLDLTRLEIDHINAMLEKLGYSADAVHLKGTQ